MTFTLADGSVVTLSELQTMIIEAEMARNKAEVSKEDVCLPSQ
jgi:hypothetical protein